MQQNQATILSGANALYVSELYGRFATDPGSVDPSWAEFFGQLGDEGRSVLAELQGPPWGKNGAKVIGAANPDAAPAPKKAARRTVGRRTAPRDYRFGPRPDADPRLPRPRPSRRRSRSAWACRIAAPFAELDYRSFGFTEADLDRPIFIDNVLGLETATLREIVRDRAPPPIAARSASSSPISRIRRRKAGSRSASSRSTTRPSSPNAASSPSSNG